MGCCSTIPESVRDTVSSKTESGGYSKPDLFDYVSCNELEDNIKKGNIDYVKDLCQQRIKGFAAGDVDLYSAMKMAVKYNQLDLAVYILRTFNWHAEIDLISLVVAKCRENCSCYDGDSKVSEKEVKPVLASCKHYESAKIFFKHMRNEKRPMRFLTEPWAQFQAGEPFKAPASKMFVSDHWKIKIHSGKIKSKGKRSSLKGSEPVRRINVQSNRHLSSQEMELREKDDTWHDISDVILGLPSSVEEEAARPFMSRVGGRQLLGSQKETSSTSFVTNVSELLLQPNVSNIDTNTSFTFNTRSWPRIGPEFSISKKRGRGALMDTSSRLSFAGKIAGSRTENKDSPEEDANRSPKISGLADGKRTGRSNINSSPTTSVISSSTFSATTPTVPKMTDEFAVSDTPISGLQEKLFTAAFSGNLELLCGLCNRGATVEEIAVAFTIAKSVGFNEIADELMFGFGRLKRLTQSFLNISHDIGPPVSKICYGSWRIIAEMCINIAPPPPLSTRKAKVFFTATPRLA